MYYVIIALVAVIVVMLAWIVLEAKARFRRRIPAISRDAAAKRSADTSVGPRGPLA